MARSEIPVEFTPAQQKSLEIISRYSPEMLQGEHGLTMSDEDILAICQDPSCCPSAKKREHRNEKAGQRP
jgi:hypothetical protein